MIAKILIIFFTGVSIANAQLDQGPNQISPETGTEAQQQSSYFAISLSYVLSPVAKIDREHTGQTGPSSYYKYTDTTNYKFDNSFKLGFEWSQLYKNSWNHGASLEILILKLSPDHHYTPYACAGSCPPGLDEVVTGQFNILTVAYSGKYLFETVYVPVVLGLPFSSIFSGDESVNFSTTLYGSSGIGKIFENKYILELKFSQYQVETKYNGYLAEEKGPNFMTNFELTAKMLF